MSMDETERQAVIQKIIKDAQERAQGSEMEHGWIEGQLGQAPQINQMHMAALGLRQNLPLIQNSLSAQASGGGANPMLGRQANMQAGRVGSMGGAAAQGLDYMGDMASVGLEQQILDEKLRAMQEMQAQEIERQRTREEAAAARRAAMAGEKESDYARAYSWMGGGREGSGGGILSDERLKRILRAT